MKENDAAKEIGHASFYWFLWVFNLKRRKLYLYKHLDGKSIPG